MSNQEQTEYINLIQKHNGIIYKVIGLYISNPEDKKDLHQEVLLQAWRSYKNFKGHSEFSTWLYKVTLNTVLTFKKKNIKNEDIDKVHNFKSSEERKEDYEVLFHIIKSFGEIERMLISLHLDGYKNSEIAEITGMTQNNITVKIHRIKAKITEKFKMFNNG